MFVQELLRASARRVPTRTALVAGERRWSYVELMGSVDALARAFRRRGLRPGDRVAIDLGNRAEAVVAIWASLEAGAAFVCVDASTPTASFARLLADCRPRALLTRPDRLSALPREDRPPILLGVDEADPGAERLEGLLLPQPDGFSWDPSPDGAASPPCGPGAPDAPERRLANIVYTSGSTGVAKGVAMSHGSMGAAIAAITSYLEAAVEDITLCVLPLSFDYGLYQVLMAGATGSCLVLEPGFGYAGRLLELLRRERISTLPGVPTLSALLLQREGFHGGSLPDLRVMTNTGAALPPAHVAELRRRFPGLRLYLMYGLTECKRVSYLPPEQLDRRPGSVGRPMPGCEVDIVDARGRPVPDGGEGELVVRGPHLMMGYWERPDDTSRVLRPGPWPGERCLFTGDRFRRDAEGFLYFLGRDDDVLKCRGEKVAPVEVERALHAMPGVAEAAVVGAEHPVLGQAVLAYVVPRQGAELSPRAVRVYCAQHLESFKVPSEVLVVESLPRTAHGKIDRARLASGELEASRLVDEGERRR